MKTHEKKKNIEKLPYFLLIASSLWLFSNLFLVSWEGHKLASWTKRAILETIKNPRESFHHKNFVWALKSQAAFIEDNIPEKSKTLFVNDQTNGSETFVYYNIYLYTDKNIKFYFEVKHKDSEAEIIKSMKENGIEYLFSFKNPNPIYQAAKNLSGKSFILHLRGEKLEVIATYE